MMNLTPNYKDARIQFVADGPNGATFIRYDDCLYALTDFVQLCKYMGLTYDFATEYIKSLDLEIL